MDKTNVHRLLDVASISYTIHSYDPSLTDGEKIAATLGEDPSCVFKTLVTEDANHNHYVFCIPVHSKLNLKKAAKACGAKSIAMILQKTLLPLTGYVHGGCSPIGMKKPFPTYIDETAQIFDTIFVSAGKLGQQVELSPLDLCTYIKGNFADLTD